MAKPIEIKLVANTTEFSRGAKDAEKSLEGVADSLDDLTQATAKDADKLGKNISDGVEDGAKDAGKATDRLESKFKDTFDGVKKKADDAGDGMGTSFKRGADKAGEGLDEVKRESESTAKESAASFDGTAESIGDAFQEIAANAFAGFGPAGALAGIAAAAGIGLVFSKMDEGAEKTEAFKEKVGELTQELIDSGDEAGPSLEYIVDRLKDLASETDEAETSLKDLYDISKKSGSSFEDLAQAYAGNADGLKELQELGKQRLEDLDDEAAALDTTSKASEGKYGALMNEAKAQEGYNQYLDEAAKLAEEAQKQEEYYIQSGAAAMEQRAEAQETLQGQLEESIGLWEELGGTEEVAADPTAVVAGMKAKNDAVTGYYQQAITFAEKYGLTAEETQALIEQGPDFSKSLAAIESSGQGEAFTQEFKKGVSGAEQAVADGDYTAEAEVKVKAETGKAEKEIKAVADKKYEADVKVTTSNKANAIDDINKVAKNYTAKVKVSADTSDAATAISNFINKKRSLTITANIVDKTGKKVD